MTAGCTVATGTVSDSACTATSSTYVVYPQDGTDKDQVDSIAAKLQQFVDNNTSIESSNTKTLGLNYWLIPLNQSSADRIHAMPGVRTIYPNDQIGPVAIANKFKLGLVRVHPMQYFLLARVFLSQRLL